MLDKRPGRNVPCWCGSGKKYKHCHLPADTKAETDRNGTPIPRARDFLEIQESILGPRQLRSDEAGPDRR